MHLNNKIGAKASLTKIWGIGHQRVKNLPAMQETWVQSLDQEDSLEKGMSIHSSILDWRIPRTEEPGRLQSMRSQRDKDVILNTHQADLRCKVL